MIDLPGYTCTCPDGADLHTVACARFNRARVIGEHEAGTLVEDPGLRPAMERALLAHAHAVACDVITAPRDLTWRDDMSALVDGFVLLSDDLAHAYGLLNSKRQVCGWCHRAQGDRAIGYATDDELQAHLRTCERSPLVQQIAAHAQEITALRDTISEIRSLAVRESGDNMHEDQADELIKLCDQIPPVEG